jgi:hypothetical protein
VTAWVSTLEERSTTAAELKGCFEALRTVPSQSSAKANDAKNMKMKTRSNPDILPQVYLAIDMLRNRRVWQRMIVYPVVEELNHGQSKPSLPLNLGIKTPSVATIKSGFAERVDALTR